MTDDEENMKKYVITEKQLKEHTILCVAYGSTDNVRTCQDLSAKLDDADVTLRSHPLSDELEKEREKMMDEFKWMKPLCFIRYSADCDTRCAWIVRKRCIEALRGDKP